MNSHTYSIMFMTKLAMTKQEFLNEKDISLHMLFYVGVHYLSEIRKAYQQSQTSIQNWQKGFNVLDKHIFSFIYGSITDYQFTNDSRPKTTLKHQRGGTFERLLEKSRIVDLLFCMPNS